MDKIDIMIFKSLLQGDISAPLTMDPRQSFRAVSRKLGIDEMTIRNRLQKFHKTGFLKGWRLLVSPALLGVNMVQLLVEVRSSSKEDLIEKVRLLTRHGGNNWTCRKFDVRHFRVPRQGITRETDRTH